MANPYAVTLKNIVSDGTNIFVTLQIFDGSHTLPQITVLFPVGTSAAAIQSYAQAVANNQPSLSSDIAVLVDSTITGQ